MPWDSIFAFIYSYVGGPEELFTAILIITEDQIQIFPNDFPVGKLVLQTVKTVSRLSFIMRMAAYSWCTDHGRPLFIFEKNLKKGVWN
jgi:hypothetical protein